MSPVALAEPEQEPNGRPLTDEQVTGDLREYVGCGVGAGADCCCYLTIGMTGWQCEQKSVLGEVLARRAEAGLMNARRVPTGEFPGCQSEGRSDDLSASRRGS